MNIERLTVISLRRLTSRTVPRWSVKVSSDESEFRYLTWVLLLNLSRNGTLASSDVFQIIIPSWYRSTSVGTAFSARAGSEDTRETAASVGGTEAFAAS